MAKTRLPLLSFEAVGRLSEVLTFRRRKKTTISEKIPIPFDRQSTYQLSWRTMFLKCRDLWWTLSALERLEWESNARRHHMTGFAYYMSQCLRPNPGIYLPLAGGTMSGVINMGANKIANLATPTANKDAATKLYVDTSIPPGGYTEGARVYHNANQAIPNAAHTILDFNSERYDTDNIHSAPNTTRLTCQTAGKYVIVAQVQWAANLAGFRMINVRLNGVATYIALTSVGLRSDGGQTSTTTTVWDMSVGDYVEVMVYQNSGGVLNVLQSSSRSPEFIIQRIG